MDPTGIEKVIGVLEDMTEKGIILDFAVGGAFAATLLNEPIATVDLDIFFLLAEGGDELILSLDAIYRYAEENGFQFDHEFINIFGWLVQFVEASRNDLWREAIESANMVEVGHHKIPVIDAVHLVSMWLLAGRARDYQKIAIFLDAGLVDMPDLFNVLDKHNLMTKWERQKWRLIDDPE